MKALRRCSSLIVPLVCQVVGRAEKLWNADESLAALLPRVAFAPIDFMKNGACSPSRTKRPGAEQAPHGPVTGHEKRSSPACTAR